MIGPLVDLARELSSSLAGTVVDLLPIVVILFGFQVAVLRRPIPHLRSVLVGFVLVLLGMVLFLSGLEQALFPLGRLMASQLTAPEFVGIYEIMSKPVVTIDPQMDIRYCARLFDRIGLSRAPLVGGGRILGIVSYTDLVLKGMCRNL